MLLGGAYLTTTVGTLGLSVITTETQKFPLGPKMEKGLKSCMNPNEGTNRLPLETRFFVFSETVETRLAHGASHSRSNWDPAHFGLGLGLGFSTWTKLEFKI